MKRLTLFVCSLSLIQLWSLTPAAAEPSVFTWSNGGTTYSVQGLSGQGLIDDGQGNIYRVLPDGRRMLVASASQSADNSPSRGAFADRDGNRIADTVEESINKSPNAKIRVFVNGHFGAGLQGVESASRRVSATVLNRFSSINAIAVSVSASRIREIANDPSVRLIEPDLPVSIPSPVKTQGLTAWRPNNPVTAAAAVPGYSTWRGVFDGSGIDVAVLDTGVDARHADLQGRVVYGGYFTEASDLAASCAATPIDRAVDVDGHGTHVAGIIAGSGQTNGMAPAARIISYRVLNCRGSGYMSEVSAGLQAIIDNNNKNGLHIKIANMSLGSSAQSDGTDPTSRLVNLVVASGVTVFVAAGNDGLNGRGTIGTPGSARYATTIGAIAGEAAAGVNLAFFSSRGSALSGVNKPDVVAPGVDILSARAVTTDFNESTPVSGVVPESGTSMATPWAAGLAALMLQKDPTLTSSGTACAECLDGVSGMSIPIRARMTSTATDRSKTGWDPEFGFGLLEPERSLAPSVETSRYPAFSVGTTNFVSSGNIKRFSLDHRGGIFALTLSPDVSVAASRNVITRNVSLYDSSGTEIALDASRIYNETTTAWPFPSYQLQFTSGTALASGRYQLEVSMKGFDADVYLDVQNSSSVTDVSNYLQVSLNQASVQPGQSGSAVLSLSASASSATTFSVSSSTADLTITPNSLTLSPGQSASVAIASSVTSTLSAGYFTTRAVSTSDPNLLGFATPKKYVYINAGKVNANASVQQASLKPGEFTTAGSATLWMDSGTRVLPAQNGKLVFFTSPEALVPTVSAGPWHLYVRNSVTGSIALVSSTLSNGGPTRLYDVTPDGSRLLISTTAQLVPEDTDNSTDLYTLDWPSLTPRLMSVRADGSNVDVSNLFYTYWSAALSPDGTRVAFKSIYGFVAGDADGSEDLYGRSVLTNDIRKLSTSPLPGDMSSFMIGEFYATTFDSTGQYVSFARLTEIARTPTLISYRADEMLADWVSGTSIILNATGQKIDSALSVAFDSAGTLYYWEETALGGWSIRKYRASTTPGGLIDQSVAVSFYMEVLAADASRNSIIGNISIGGGNWRYGEVTLSAATPTPYQPFLTEAATPAGYLTLARQIGSNWGFLGGYTFQAILISDDNDNGDAYLLYSKAAPEVTSVSPGTTAVGQQVRVLGRGFGAVSQLTIGATQVTNFTIESDGSILATVPTGAQSGAVVVTTPSGASNSTVSIVVGGSSPAKPAPPTGIAGDASVSLSWSAPNDNGAPITSYDVTFSTSTKGNFKNACSTPSTQCVVKGLSNGTAYYFKVRATNSIGTGVYSDPSSPITPATIPAAPSAPTTTAGNTQATVAWNKPIENGSIIVGYQIQMSNNSGASWTTPAGCGSIGTSLSCTALSLTNGTAYIFQVRAQNGIGWGPWSPSSAPVTPTSTSVTTPGAVSNLQATGAAPGSLLVQWGAPVITGGAPITSYEFRYKLVSGNKWGGWTSTTQLSTTLTRLKSGSQYSIEVRAINVAGPGTSVAVTATAP